MNPRAYGACAESASCTPSFNSAPETGLCNDALCFSARLPSLLEPSTGSVHAFAVSSTTSQFDLTVVDEYGDPVQVQLLVPPQSGSLFFDGEELSAGDVLGSTEGPGPSSFELTFVEDSQIDMVFFTVRLSNGVDDGVRDVDVALYRNARPWLFSTREVSLGQDGSSTVAFSMIGTDSQPAGFEQVSLSPPPGFASVTSATSDATGRVQFTLSAGAVAAGSYSIDLETPSGRTASIPVVVSQTAGSLTVTAQDLSQGASASASVLVRDRVSAPMESAAVSFATAPTGFGFALGVRTALSGCFTDGSGSCSVLLLAESAAAGGAYVLTARSGGITAVDSFSVASVPSRLAAAALTLPQSGTGSWSLTVKDGAGGSLPGRTVSVVSTPAGVSLTPSSQVSSAGGVVSFSVSVAASAQPGPVSVSFTVDSVPVSASLMVAQTPSSVSSQGTVQILRGSTASSSVRILDSSGNPVPNVSLVFSPSSGLRLASGLSDSDGFAKVSLAASASASKGVRTVAFSTNTLPPVSGSMQVEVSSVPTTVSLSGTVPQGGRTALAVAVFDREGDPVPNVVVQLSGLPPSIDVSPRSVTNSSGVASIPVLDKETTALGTYSGRLKVSIEGAPRLFSVLVPVSAAPSSRSVPSALPAPTASAVSSSSLSVAFLSPLNDGGGSISSYRIYVNGSLTASPTSSPSSVSGLLPDTVYSVAASACNDLGCSPVSAPTSVRTFPAAPSSVAVSPSGVPGVLEVTWQNPVSTPDAVLLRVKISTSSSWMPLRRISASAESYTITGLQNGLSYDVQVGASNVSGTTWSTSASASPASPPSPPDSFEASFANSTPTLSWVAPSSNGGSPVTSIRVYRNKLLLATLAPSALSYLDSGAPNGSYSYSVAACNAIGCSPSSPSRSVTV